MKFEGPIVSIVEDDNAISQSLQMLFNSVSIRTSAYKDGFKFLNAYDSKQWGCILLDIRLPQMSGLVVQQQLNKMKNHIPIIFLTGHAEVSLAIKALKSGAYDFLLKPYETNLLLDLVQKIIFEEKEKQLAFLEIKQQFNKLTSRERIILEDIAMGKANKVMAIEHSLSISTIEQTRARIIKKLNAKNTAGIVKAFYQWQHQEAQNKENLN